MNNPICVIGSGGREFTLAYKLHNEGYRVIAIPGNDGMERLGIAQTIPLPPNFGLRREHSKHLVDVTDKYKPSLIVIGPEDWLAVGAVDNLQKEGHMVFGSRKKESIVEASKCWSSDFMKRNGIPTPDFYNPENYQEAVGHVKKRKLKVAIKGDGLAKGKGVIIPHTLEEATEALYAIMIDGKLGGPRVNIQDFVDIEYELSAMAFVDVRRKNESFHGDYRLLPFSMDHKSLLDDDKGPNTGGMGAVAPIPINNELRGKVISDVIERTVEGFIKEGIEFNGCLYPALAVDRNGRFYVLEYNMRFGDPETQVVLYSMASRLQPYLMATATGELGMLPEIVTNDYSAIVNLVSPGYPHSPEIGLPINGLDDYGQLKRPIEGQMVIHSGTKAIMEGNKVRWATNGGRVLGIMSSDPELSSAVCKSYLRGRGDFSGFHGLIYRTDIGKKALKLFT